MKKLIIIAFLLIPSLTFASFDRNLKIGISGTDVADLQDILNTENCFSHASTGYFGPLTLEAVKCFQAKNNIDSTGYVGVLTRGALNTILSGAVESSNQAEIKETGTTTTASTACPVGFNCTPVNQPVYIPFTTPTPTPTPTVIGSQNTATPTPKNPIISITDQNSRIIEKRIVNGKEYSLVVFNFTISNDYYNTIYISTDGQKSVSISSSGNASTSVISADGKSSGINYPFFGGTNESRFVVPPNFKANCSITLLTDAADPTEIHIEGVKYSENPYGTLDDKVLTF